jgi:hypothetical protein
MRKYFSWKDGKPVDCPSDMDYDTSDLCDNCSQVKLGRMFHAAGATGRVCEVLFLCRECMKSRNREFPV